MRIATFNVQNLRLRRRGGRARFDGARDGDMPQDAGPAAAALDLADRRLTAAVIAAARADVVCLQEVFDRAALDRFHKLLLVPRGAVYPHRLCLPGNDGAGRDVAILARLPPDEAESHAALRPEDLGLPPPSGARAGTPVFRRDCVRARFGTLTLFLCHFKAPWPDAVAAWEVRRCEALAVRALIARRFPDPARGLWLVLGDLNEPAEADPRGRATAPLLDCGADLLARLPAEERWTWVHPDSGQRSAPDVLLASPELAARWPDARPEILRLGLGRGIGDAAPRLPDVGQHRPHASDHAAVVIDLPGL